MNARAVLVASTASDLVSLTKPRLSSLVLVTAAGGMWMAPGSTSAAKAVVTLLAIAGTVGAANALNCFLERDSDRFMRRTARRPLPTGKLVSEIYYDQGYEVGGGTHDTPYSREEVAAWFTQAGSTLKIS